MFTHRKSVQSRHRCNPCFCTLIFLGCGETNSSSASTQGLPFNFLSLYKLLKKIGDIKKNFDIKTQLKIHFFVIIENVVIKKINEIDAYSAPT